MKRILLLAAVMVGLFAVQASAGLYTMDVPTAIQLRDVSWSDTEAPAFGSNVLTWVGYNPGTTNADRVYGAGFYGASMYYDVGFKGNLSDDTGDGLASVWIGAKDNASLLATLQGLGSFDGFYLPISNDNNQNWQYKLYVDTTGSDYISGSWTTLGTATQDTLTLPFGSSVDFSTLEDIGFIVRMNSSLIGGNLSDDFHTSVVPVPGAVLLGMLGLSVAGIKLRKHA